MTDAEREIYARMSEAERKAIDRCSEPLRSAAFVAWENSRGRFARRMPSREEAEVAPRREFVDDSERRFP